MGTSATSTHNRPTVLGRDGTTPRNPSRPPIEGTGGTAGRPEENDWKAERVHASIEARTATTTGHRDKGAWRRCEKCGAGVIRALDDTVAAFTATVDPRALTRADELTALLSGRDTYSLTVTPRLTLRRRDRWQIAGHPADTVTAVAAHACHAPLGQPLPTPTPRSTDAHPAF